MTSKNQKYIDCLKNEVCLKFGRTLESTTDFDALSGSIQKNISESISPSTLKRVFGYVKYGMTPSATTLSILARYVGYSGWSDFCKNYDLPEKHKGLRLWNGKKNKWTLVLFISCLILVSACLVMILSPGKFRHKDVATQAQDAMPADSAVYGTVISKAPVKEAEDEYQRIRTDCLMTVRHKVDSMMAMRGQLPLYRYMEKCDSAYYHIAFTYIKPYIEKQVSSAFQDNDTLRSVYCNDIFSACRDMAVELMTQFTTEERIMVAAERQKALGF